MERNLAIVSWLWTDARAKHKFNAEHVNAWARMVKRHCTLASRIVCITDSPEGITECETYPIWEAPPIKAAGWREGRPQCYRRMRIFDPEIARSFGTYVVSMDLDVVITDNIDPLFADFPDFRIMQGGGKRNCYNGSMWVFRHDARPQIWSEFTPERAVEASTKFMGSDQAWMREILGDKEQVWNSKHGAFQFLSLRTRILPKEAKLVFFAGQHKPWHFPVQRAHRWVIQHWGQSTENAETMSELERRVRSRRTDARIKKLKAAHKTPELPISEMPDIDHKDTSDIRPPHQGGKFWVFDDDTGWGLVVFFEALKRGWDAQLFKGAGEVEEPGYVFMRINQEFEGLIHEKAIALKLYNNGNVMIPSIETIMEYEDKALQYDQYREWMPRTVMFYDAKSAIDHAKIREYPVISKAKTGSGSHAVRLHQDKASLIAEIHTLFSAGIEVHMGELQKGYLMLQDFLPNNKYAYRVVAVGSERLVFRILNRDDRPMASGSGKIDHSEYSAEAKEVLAFANTFFSKYNLKWCAVDIIFDPKRVVWRILETSLAWNMRKRGSNLSRKFESGRPVAYMFEVLLDQIEAGEFST